MWAKKKLEEAVDESIGNWLKTAMLGGIMAASPLQSNAQSNDSGVQKGTYWELTKDQNKPQQLSKEAIKPMMQNIKAVSDNLTDYSNFIANQLSSLNPQQRTEIEKALLSNCIKNQQTGKLIKVNNFTIDDAAYIKQVYDSGDNIMTINIGNASYFAAVSSINNAMMIMGLQQGTPSVVKMLMMHK